MASSLECQQAAAGPPEFVAATATVDPTFAAFQQQAGHQQQQQQHWDGLGGAVYEEDQQQAQGSDSLDAGLDLDEEEDAAAAEDDADDSDYNQQEAAAGRRWGSDDEEDSDPDYEDAHPAAKRRRAPTPPGARRSVRIKHKVVDVVHEFGDDELEGSELQPRRGLRSFGPMSISSAPSLEAFAGQGSRAGSEQPPPPLLQPVVGGLAPLPNPKDIRREFTEEEMAADFLTVKGMWEMAAILDFFNLFRKQLNLTRSFAASELEHVLSYSDGKDGLLADLHIDIMRGISPKQDVPRDAWQVHLANKIKYHWRPLLSGIHCPFKPDKYFEAYTYARLPAEDRVRALHFLCTIRCDREDIQFRVAESYTREWTQGELALVLQAQHEALKNGRPEDAPQADFTPDVFRRQPNGLDRHGNRYYIFNFLQVKGFRMYRDTPASQHAPAAAAGGSSGDAADAPNGPAPIEPAAAGLFSNGAVEVAVVDANGCSQAAALPAAGATAAAEQQPNAEQDAAPARLAADVTDYQDSGFDSDTDSYTERQQRLLNYQVPPDPELEGGWDLVASTLEEFQDFANRFGSGENPREVQFSLIIRQYVLPAIQAIREEEERKAKAAERVQRKLGVAAAAAATGAAVAGASGSGGSGAVAAGTRGAAAVAVAPQDGGRDLGGRSRRARQRINYAFSEYDETLRSAIRQTQRGEDDSEDEGSGRRRRRRVPSPTGDPLDAARGGLRRGRSAAAIKEDVVEVNHFVDERQLRAAVVAHRGSMASSRAASRAGSGVDLAQLQDLPAQQEPLVQKAGVQQNGTLQEADASAFVTAAAAATAGRRAGGCKQAFMYEEDEEEEEEDSEPDAGADGMSEDEFVPGRQ